jgi:adenylate cyclase
LEPDFIPAHFFLSQLYSWDGKNDLAIAESRRTIDLGFPFGQSLLAQSYAAAGRKAEALAALKESIDQSKRSYAGAFFIVQAFEALGDKDQTFYWLEKSYEEHEPILVHLNEIPFHNEACRADPRFQDLVSRIGIPTQ